MKRALMVLQLVLGIYFLFVGVMHFVLPEGLPAQMGWMYELSPALHWLSGSAEVLAGLALLGVPLIRRYGNLVPLAAAGLVLTMLGAMAWHLSRGEASNIVQNLIVGAFAAFLAYQRWKTYPLSFS